MNTKPVRLMLIGMIVGIVAAMTVSSGVFNEAGQAKEAATAWCAGTCQ